MALVGGKVCVFAETYQNSLKRGVQSLGGPLENPKYGGSGHGDKAGTQARKMGNCNKNQKGVLME